MTVQLGPREDAPQFALLVALNALVGAMVGLERSVLPLVGEDDFGLTSTSAILAFVVAFGFSKALANLAAGGLADLWVTATSWTPYAGRPHSPGKE
jgi:hypothetical protein